MTIFAGLSLFHQPIFAQSSGVTLLGPITNARQPIIVYNTRESLFSPTVIVPPASGGTESISGVIVGQGSASTVESTQTNSPVGSVVAANTQTPPVVVTGASTSYLPPELDTGAPVLLVPPPIITPPLVSGVKGQAPRVNPPVANPFGASTPGLTAPPPALPGNFPGLPGGQPGLSTGLGFPARTAAPPPPFTRAPGSRF